MRETCKTIDGLGLESVYGATIERIKAQGRDGSRLEIGVLIWIMRAQRPLRRISVRNRPGAPRGPPEGLPRAPDGTGRLAVVRPGRPQGRTAVFG